ncbi:hypothetical protein GCM10029964_028360 [Kibdelosporangium lantanae]
MDASINDPSAASRDAISFPASPMWPSTRISSAPAATHSACVMRGAPVGIATRLLIPARAPYSAHAAPAFPLLGMANPVTPSSEARDTPTAAPRALKEPVGIRPSSFISNPGTSRSLPSVGIGSNGVMPSPRLTTRSAERTGSTSWYRHNVGGRTAMSDGDTDTEASE